MITENGTIKVRTVIDEKAQKEFSANANKIALTMLIMGCIGVCVFLVLDIVLDFLYGFEDSIFFVLLIVFAVFLACGIFLKIFLNKALKQVRNSPKVNEYEFCSDHFTVNQISNGEVVATAKFYYAQVMKIKDGKNYFNIFISQTQVFPVEKSAFTADESAMLKSIFPVWKG